MITDRPPLNAGGLVASDDDRRAFRRFACNMLAFVRLPDAPDISQCDVAAATDEALYTPQAVPVKDISMTGLFFFSKLPYPVDAAVEVRLCLGGAEFAAPAVIERRVRVDNAFCGYGVSFLQSRIDKPLRVALASFLLRQDCVVPRH